MPKSLKSTIKLDSKKLDTALAEHKELLSKKPKSEKSLKFTQWSDSIKLLRGRIRYYKFVIAENTAKVNQIPKILIIPKGAWE